MGLKRLFPILILFGIFVICRVLSADTVPTILILHGGLPESFAEIVERDLESQLKSTDLQVDVEMRRVMPAPTSKKAWIRLAQSEHWSRSTIAVFGLSCEDSACTLMIISPASGALVMLPIPPSTAKGPVREEAAVSTIREAILGPLIPELNRLSLEAAHPGPPPKSTDSVLLQSPFESERAATSVRRPWLFLSLGYHGDHPHPGGHPIHGPFVGADFELTRLLGLGIQVGWLGIREEAVQEATATIQRVDTTLALRLFFSLGPARISLSALGRLDAAFVKKNHVGIPDERETLIEFQTGGLTMWHLPLPWKNTDAWVGAGVVVSVVTDEVELVINGVDRETAMPSTTVRMIWCAGVAFSPIH